MAHISGIAIRPCVSLNNRLYTKAALNRAFERMHQRISDPAGPPITMRSHHGAGDDSLRIAGRVTKVTLADDGAIAYEGDTADTEAGRTIATLATADDDGAQFLRNVSIRGYWLGEVKTNAEGNQYADDLEIDGLDFTASPGVPGASVSVESDGTDSLDESHGRTFLAESAAPATFSDEGADEAAEADKEPYGAVNYADPGYQKDKKKRYPLNTAARVRAAWSYINMAKNADKYTSKQLANIKGKIKKAAKGFDINLSESADDASKAITELAEAAVEEACASMNVFNGAGDVSISGYVSDPAQLKALATKIAAAAVAALVSLDPDNDGDIDGLDATESAAPPSAGGASATTKEANVPKTETETETKTESATGTETAAAADEAVKAAVKAELNESLPKIVEAAVAQALVAAAPTKDNNADRPKVTVEDLSDDVIAAVREKIRDELVNSGVRPERKGLVRRLGESDQKSSLDLAKMSSEELRQYAAGLWDDVLPVVR